MPGSASPKYYFELLLRDLTGDYTRQFFLARARLLRVLRLNTHLIRKDESYVDQSRQVLQNGRGFKKAKLRIGRAYDRVIRSHCVIPIHDLSAAYPFAEMTRFA